MDDIDPDVLTHMRSNSSPDTKWAAYQNVAMDSSLHGHIQFLRFGKDCTFTERPEKMPDTKFD